MGARANFVLIDGDGLRLHYSHWGADQVCSALVAGPAAAGRFIAAQHRCDDPVSGWLDDVWAEGGAVVDHTARRLFFYGDQLRDSCTGLVPGLAGLWPQWRVEFWEDRYEEQLARCDGAVTVPGTDPAGALDEVVSRLGRRRGHDPVPGMLDLVREHAGDRPAELNPYFTAHRQVDAADDEWDAVLRAAAQLRARLTSPR
jgi:hypothetical protein